MPGNPNCRVACLSKSEARRSLRLGTPCAPKRVTKTTRNRDASRLLGELTGGPVRRLQSVGRAGSQRAYLLSSKRIQNRLRHGQGDRAVGGQGHEGQVVGGI